MLGLSSPVPSSSIFDIKSSAHLHKQNVEIVEILYIKMTWYILVLIICLPNTNIESIHIDQPLFETILVWSETQAFFKRWQH